jgi:hypothetical protein
LDHYTYDEFNKIIEHCNNYKNVIESLLTKAFDEIDKDGLLNKLECNSLVKLIHESHKDIEQELKNIMNLYFYKDKDGKFALDDIKDWFWKAPKHDPFKNLLKVEFIKSKPELNKLLS